MADVPIGRKRLSLKNKEFIEILPEVIEDDSLIVSWRLTNVCNFDCHYCANHETGRNTERISAEDVIECLKKTGRECSVIMAGGEVFLIPNFVDICKKLIDAGMRISIETNLSAGDKVMEFAEKIDPSKVDRIYVSAHILEREKRGLRDELIQNILLLKRKGFRVRVNYVMHPALLKRFERDYGYFKAKGIELWPRPFIGVYKDMRYPEAYSDKERALILDANPEAGRESILNKTAGLLCGAGRTFIRIEKNGEIFRCYGDGTLIGNVRDGVALFERPRPCPVETCPCWGWYFLTDRNARDRVEKKFKKASLKSQLKKIKPLYFCWRLARQRARPSQ